MVKNVYLKRNLDYRVIKKAIAIMSIGIIVGVNNVNAYASTELNANEYLSKYSYSNVTTYDAYVISEDIMKEYETLLETYYKKGIIIDISIEEFAELYEKNQLSEIIHYTVEEKLYENDNLYDSGSEVTAVLSSSSTDDRYYFNTGTARPSECYYDKYDLLDVVRMGDLIHEHEGGGTLTGHTLIVEGKFYDASSKKYYIRVIEARKYYGVTRGVLDDIRVDERTAQIIRPAQPGYSGRKTAVEFAVSQLGKGYLCDVPAKDTSEDEDDWYCSELVWAAYKSAGYDIEQPASFNEPGVTPRDLVTSSVCYTVSLYK